MPEGRLAWLVIAVVWMAAAFGTGAALAWIQSRAYPDLSFYKLWAFWTAVGSAVVLAVLVLGLLDRVVA